MGKATKLAKENLSAFGLSELYHGEYDPGSERTLAARLKHASRTATWSNPGESGERVSKT